MKTIIFTIIIFSITLFAQEKDSVRTYTLEEITVEASKELEARTIDNIEFGEIEKLDAPALSDLGELVPALKVQTNSRGETLFYLRGAGERKIMLFFDGVPLNIPWDNRIDLSLIPSAAIGQLSVTKGIPSVIYGANSISGVVNINSKKYNGNSFGKVILQGGENNFQNYSALYLNGNEKINYLVSSSYNKTDGYSLPESYNNPANPEDLRINTQYSIFNLLGKVDYKFSNAGKIGLSASYNNSTKGVAPETDVEGPRFWKYPLWERLSVSLNGDYSFRSAARPKIDFSFAATNFKSEIDQYTAIDYNEIDDIEKNNDLILNGRVVFSSVLGTRSVLKASLSGFSALHKEEIKSENYELKRYVQNVLSAGIEYEYLFHPLFVGIAGVGYDISATPETGDKPSSDPLHDYNINLGLIYSYDFLNSFHISVGRKTRFPTLRESFSGALGRFVPNPGLRAEVAYSGEIGYNRKFAGGNADAIFFLSFYNDGIVRKALPERQFQRVNQDAIKTYGIEISYDNKLSRSLSLYFHFTYMNSRAKNDNGEFVDSLEYNPQFIGTADLTYQFPFDLRAFIELRYIGEEFGYREGNEYFQRLPDYFLADIRLSYMIYFTDNFKTELYGRVNNIFDRLYYTQWGLPSPGRQFFAGVNVEF